MGANAGQGVRFRPGVREVPLPKMGAGSTAHTFLSIVTMLSLFNFISRCRDGESAIQLTNLILIVFQFSRLL